MAKVSNLKIALQGSSGSTVYASWDFKDPTPSSSSGGGGGSVAVGSWVRVKSGSTWYNGAGIPSFVYNYKWRVLEIRGDRAVINESDSGGFRILSAIRVGNLQPA